jgi:hypothetical protein
MSSWMTLRFARIARSNRLFAKSRNRTIAACSSSGGTSTGIRRNCSGYRRSLELLTPVDQR